MPYNTRRKSLSLPSLGIHVPVTHAERAAAAAAAAASAAASRHDPHPRSNNGNDNHHSSPRESVESHPCKKIKRSHASDGPSPSRSRPTPTAPSSPKAVRVPEPRYDHTPPPSPKSYEPSGLDDGNFDHVSELLPVVDLEGINDDIVEAVIVRLQDTRNRPHLVKELASILSQKLSVVQNSANQCAIISSRLSAYLKRTCWSAIAPCPLAKELETVHPRRTYFFLTTYARQPLPDQSTTRMPARAFISPSISSIESASDEGENDRRREISPSPEVDLSSPDFDDGDDDIAMPSTPIGSLPARTTFIRGHRSASPPLEKDEREFTQTADGLQKRKLSRELLVALPSDHSMDIDDVSREEIWFGETKTSTAGSMIPAMAFVSSPAIRPSFPSTGNRKEFETEPWLRAGRLLDWDVSPEAIELDELDCLLEAC